MQWIKQGKVFAVNRHFDWMVSHSQVPTVLPSHDRFQVFFATRNAAGKSQIGLVELDAKQPKTILHTHPTPALALGKPGTFDEDGVMPSSVLKKDNEIWLYYTGWNQKVATPYHNAIGLAISMDGGYTFERVSDGPILDRTRQEPYIAVTPHVIVENNQFKMWYATGTQWLKVNEKFEPVYAITSAVSADGIHWERTGKLCIPQRHAQEAVCTPTIIKNKQGYKMWFCHRDSEQFRDGQGSYRIGYAESVDGVQWNRCDQQAGIDFSSSGWDATMLCYPNTIKHNNQYYLFYNGNQFGRDGFGYATAAVEE